MSGSRLQRSLTVHPGKTFNAAAFAFGTFALSSTPSLFPSIVLTTVLLLQARAFLRRSFAGLHIIFLLLNLSVATTLANYSASTTALSTVGSSLGFSFLRSLATSISALIPVLITTSLNPQSKSSWLRLTFFPAVWTFIWSVICRVSPTGRLGSWTPLYGIDGYRWILPYTGLSGIDFITAFWAVVASESIGNWVQGTRPTDDEVWGDADDDNRVINGYPHAIEAQNHYTDEPIGPGETSNGHEVGEVHRRSHAEKSTKSLVSAVLLLISLTIPSFYIFNLPLPPYSQNTESVKLACVLPPHTPVNPHESTLESYLAETKRVSSIANIAIWPEAAVSFDSHQARLDALVRVEKEAFYHKIWIGVSFQEPDPTHVGTGIKRRNGIALIGPGPPDQPKNGTGEQVFEYFKHYLVPIAESYQTVPSNSPPPFFTIPLRPSGRKPPPDWPGGSHAIHHIPVTAQICLDNSQPTPQLPAQPAIILAPANTWHPNIGLPMAMLASARAEEVGANVLWCDGGSGSISGVYGANRGVQITQVGTGGTWVANIGLPYPFGRNQKHDGERSRTMYGVVGDFGTFVIVLIVMFGGWSVERTGKTVSRRLSKSSSERGNAKLLHAIGLGGLVMGATGVGHTITGGFRHAVEYIKRSERQSDEESHPHPQPQQQAPTGHLIDADD